MLCLSNVFRIVGLSRWEKRDLEDLISETDCNIFYIFLGGFYMST